MLAEKPWNSKHRHRRLSRNIIVDQRQADLLRMWEKCVSELYGRPNRS
jgi:hypothetical protein